jgi:hypothetical protein
MLLHAGTLEGCVLVCHTSVSWLYDGLLELHAFFMPFVWSIGRSALQTAVQWIDINLIKM